MNRVSTALCSCPVLLLALAARGRPPRRRSQGRGRRRPSRLPRRHRGRREGRRPRARVAARGGPERSPPTPSSSRWTGRIRPTRRWSRSTALESVPVPLILVIASNGVAAGGARPDAVTAERLAAMIPSPAKAAYLTVDRRKKATFLVFWRASMPSGRCGGAPGGRRRRRRAQARRRPSSVDLDSATEARFVAEMKVDARSTVPIVGGLQRARGSRTETFHGVPRSRPSSRRRRRRSDECCPGGHCVPRGK